MKTLLNTCAGLIFSLFIIIAAGGQEPLALNEGNKSPSDLELKTGEMEIGGVRWLIGGSEHVEALSLGDDLSPSSAVAVKSAPDRLHFLHTLRAQSGLAELEKKYRETGRLPAHPPQVFGYELTYADGSRHTIHIDWMHHVGALDQAKLQPRLYNAKPVVLSESDPRQVVYHCVTPNPFPGQEIESIRMVAPEKGSEMGEPLLLGLAVETVEPVEAFGYQWGCNDYSYLYGPTHVVVEEGRMRVPMHNKSDRAALAYVTTPVEGDFSVRMRLKDVSRYANWGSVGLSAGPMVKHIGRGGTNDNVAVYFKPRIQEGAKKDGVFVVSQGEAVKGGLVLEKGKPPVKISDDLYTYETPVWMRLDREGDVFRGFSSTDGEHWRELGEMTREQTEDAQYIMIFTCLSHSPQVEYATIDQFRLEQK